MEDLENVEEDDINSFGLNFGEKKRVKNLLSSLCKNSPGISECFSNSHLEYRKFSHRVVIYFMLVYLSSNIG